MNTKDLKAYAPKARRDFIAAVTKQAQKYGVTEAVTHPVEINGDVCVVNGKPFPASLAPKINKLGERVKNNGFEQTMEQVAYSWFNRLIAIRYMELHDYLGHGRRVLSHPEHPTGFQILEECTELSFGNSGEVGELPDLTHEKVVELKLDGTKDEELYRELLLAQCHALQKAMPFLFEQVDDETELLLPENLTKTDSLIHDLVTDISESDWDNIEVIGWLYQFYVLNEKERIDKKLKAGGVVENSEIPAKTQLFTPNWIVKYMVQNSLGAQWMVTYPDSPLKAQMEYYIEPAEQTDEVNAQLKAITPESLNPEELTLIDPASGSGHILVEAYDLFKAIYLERGYRQRDIAQLILEKNLHGLDIDQRASQLTAFSLMMKGREDDRRLFGRGVKLNVIAMVDSTSLDVDTINHGIDLAKYDLQAEDIIGLKDIFENATAFGSLIQVPEQLAEKVAALQQLSDWASTDLFVSEELKRLKILVCQCKLLAAQYDVVVANPPYMGSKGMNGLVKKFAQDYFPTAKHDLFACFIERGYTLAQSTGYNAMVTMQSWMFLTSFEEMRTSILSRRTIENMAHMGNGVMKIAFGTNATIFRNLYLDGYRGIFSHVSIGDINEQGAPVEFPVKNERLTEVDQREFKKIPGSPVSYWATESIRHAFDKFSNVTDIAQTKAGLTTGDNTIFQRYWSELSFSKLCLSAANRDVAIQSACKWFPCNSGGQFRKWYGNNEIVVNWESDGDSIRTFAAHDGRLKASPRSMDKYFSPSVTWNKISSGRFAVRFSPSGHIFDDTGQSAFTDDLRGLKLLLLCLGSASSNLFLQYLSPTLSYNKGDIAQIPIPDQLIEFSETSVDSLVTGAKADWDSFEYSWDFQSLLILTASCESAPTLESSYNAWVVQNGDTISQMKRLEEENNHLFIEAYGLQDELASEVPIEQITLTVNPAYRYGVKGTEEERNTRFREDTMKELVSYVIGCMMGRYSLDEQGLIYANSGNEGFDLLVERGVYKTFPADDDGIIPLTDKEWFADDAANRLVEFISVAWDAAHLEENLDFLAGNLSPKKGEDSRDTIRRYLCDKFYKDHMQTYKKRPIYWLFSSGKQKAFQCLVYLHRYNESTLARMRTEYVIPLTAKLSSHIDKLENDKGASGSAAEIKKLEKEIKNLHKQQTELTEFDEKLKHYADMRIPLDLDDGVKVNYGKFGDLLAEVKAIHGKVSS
jgi:type II restriction/modification system DNA methylase subunit YeeA